MTGSCGAPAAREQAADAGRQVESLTAALNQVQEEPGAVRAELARRAPAD